MASKETGFSTTSERVGKGGLLLLLTEVIEVEGAMLFKLVHGRG